MQIRQSRIKVIATVLSVCTFLAAPREAASESPSEKGYTAHTVAGLTWNDATERMERLNPLMKAARAGLDVFRAKMSQAEWAYFPKFGLEGGIAPTPEISGSALQTAVDFERWGILLSSKISMVQPIYTFGKIAALTRAAQHGVAVGNALVEAARLDLRYRLAQAWYGLQLAVELEGILQEGKKWLHRSEKKMSAQRKEDSDAYNQNEHLRLKTRVAEFFAMEAENLELKAKAQEGLRLLLQGLPKSSSSATTSLEPIQLRLESVEYYWGLAKRSEPTLRAVRATERAKVALGDHRAAKLWPDLIVVGEASTSYSDVVDVQQSSVTGGTYVGPSAAALLALKWNLDLPTLLAQRDEAQAHARKASAEADLKENTQELKVRTLYQRLKNKQKLIGVYLKSQKAAQGWLLSSWELYDDGFGEFRMVMEALVQFYGKKVSYLRTVFEFNVLIHEFSQAIGVELPAHPITRSTLSDGLASERNPQ